MSSEERLIELESRQAFQDDSLQALNDVVVIQQRQIDRLQAQMQALLKRQEEMGAPQDGEFIEEAPPPHY